MGNEPIPSEQFLLPAIFGSYYINHKNLALLLGLSGSLELRTLKMRGIPLVLISSAEIQISGFD